MRCIIVAIALLLFATSAYAEYLPPVLDNPETWVVPVGGGSHDFGSRDGLVIFPDSIVTGQVTIVGGSVVHVRGGHIRLSGSSRTVFRISNARTVFVEGLRADANDYCDVFAIGRPSDGVTANITFQNIYAEGPKYNVVDGDCHGDLIQTQTGTSNTGLNLRIDNFIGVTGAQGFFIPSYTALARSAELRNVYIRPSSGTKPLLWFSNGSPPYPVTLENVWVDGPSTRLYPNTRMASSDGQTTSWPSAEKITGVVNRGFPVDEVAFKACVGLNYDPTCFGSTPPPDPDPIPVPEPDLNLANAATMIANSGNYDPSNPVEGFWDKCTDGTTACSPGNNNVTSIWVEFDLGQLHDLTDARLFGDASGGWVSRSWGVETKQFADSPWTVAFVDDGAFVNDWRAFELNVQARYVRVVVYGDISTQAREFELLGTVVTEPDPVPVPEPDPVPVPVPVPEPDPDLELLNRGQLKKFCRKLGYILEICDDI